MSKFKNRLMKRVLAVILSGAMIMSDAALFQMTAFAAEEGTGGGYSGEASEEYKPVSEEITVKEDGDSDEKDADNAADMAEDDKNDDAADSTADDDKNNDAAEDDKNDDVVPETVAESTEDADNADDSDEKATDSESAVDDAAVVETTVEDDPQEAEENTEEETSEVEVTEEVVDNQAQTGSATITNGFAVGKDYGDSILKLSVFEAMGYTSGAEVRVDGTKYSGYVAGTNNPVKDGNIPTGGAAFKIEALSASTITFVLGKSSKSYSFVKDDGIKGEVIKTDSLDANNATAQSCDLEAGGTYYFYVSGSKPYIYAVKWESKEIDESTRPSWDDEVEDPVITGVSVDDEDSSKINVTVKGVVGLNGADRMTVYMYDSENAVKDSIVSATAQDTTTFAFTPQASGTYTFKAEMVRDAQQGKEKTSAMSEPITFTCPLVPPTNLKAESLGGGKVQIKWDAVPEVDKYIVEVVDNPEIVVDVDSTKTSAIVPDLTKGQTYSFTVCSVRGEGEAQQVSEKSEPVSCKVTDAKLTWENHRYGNGVDTSHNKITKISDTSVRLESSGGKGKIVPASTDGLAFYCTKVSTDKNFIFSANAHVNSWTFSNGQEGFGVMAADRVGGDGTGGEFWNNSYQAVVSRISYKWNGVGISTDETGEKIEMQIGVGSTEKIGVTSSDVNGISKGELEVPKRFRAGQTALDSTYAKYGAGQYNIVANCSNKDSRVDLTSKDYEEYEDFYLQVRRNNTGYFVSYTKYKTDENGDKVLDTSTTTTAKYYDRNALNVLDKNNIYVGVFTSRNADVTFSDMTLDVIDPDDDDDEEKKEVKYYNLATSILSSTVTNSTDYQFIFHSNWNGKLVLKDSAGNYLSKHFIEAENGNFIKNESGNFEKVENGKGNFKEIDYYDVTGSLDLNKSYLQDGTDEKNTKVYIDLDDKAISIGKNVFTVEYTPDKSWCPDQNGNDRYAELNSYDKVTLTHIVEYRKYGEQGQTIYVSQYGRSTNIGTKESPLDIYTAVKYAQPGQTILLAGGRYKLSKTLQTPRGVDGEPAERDEKGKPIKEKETYNNYIKMMAEDPENRPVLDFMGLVPAVVTVGDFWYFKNIDVTRCKDGEKGIQVSSSYCVFDRVDTYKNGSTGLQISRLASQDTYQDWPSDNLILNCNSYLNVDSGYEDADGFAAKLTSGSNNVFDGCIAAFNADDGWDLFAKVQSGSIGAVTIKNSIAYRNGYVLEKNGEEGNFDEFGKLRKGKGNGNGFKMGGDGLQGGSIYDDDYNENASVRKSGHKIYNSLAFYNKMKGFDSNSCPNVKAYNCVSFNNEGANFGFTSAAKNPNTDFVLENVISFRTEATTDKNNDSVAGTGTQSKSKWFNKTTYLMQTKKSSVSENTDGTRVKASDFVSLEYKSLDCVDLKYWRKEDGTVDTHGFLTVSPDSQLLANPSMGGTASNDIKEGEATDGNITGAIETEGSADDWGEDIPEGGINLNSGHYGKVWIAEINHLDYTDREPIEYTGKQIMPELHVYFSADKGLLRKGKDYTVKYYHNIEAGTATAEVTGVGNYKGFKATQTFDILPIDINPENKDQKDVVVPVSISDNIVVNDLAKVSKEIKLTWQNKTLKYGVDYTIDQDTTDKTKYIIKGGHDEQVEENGKTVTKRVGNFTGEKMVTVLAAANVPAEKQLNKATVKIIDKKITYTGKKIEPAVEVKLNGTEIKKSDGFKIECSNNLEVGKATLT
ncbi:MAG: fibronectin type III domain-containing protein, partial [Lachnospiraceae bacterium]|nr:fibronectin type III domain-containing protein [Lachnospiraceae bacterium]